ncbi:MAG: 3-deoxy-D-manno-octulosonic acid transferase, partial [Candidatus Acidiferrales bacterium]
LLILAPRKPDQFDGAAAMLAQSGQKFVRRREISLNGTGNPPLGESCEVFLLDSLGELAGLYRLADAVFVGGSLVPIGGHNILEPAAFGKPPIHGPHMENFREMAAAFQDADASIRIANAEELASAWRGLLEDSGRAARMGASARALVDRNRGATRRVMSYVEKIIGAPGASH